MFLITLHFCSSTGRAIDFVLNYVFQISAGRRPQVPALLVIITDGRSDDRVMEAVLRAKAAGILCTLFIWLKYTCREISSLSEWVIFGILYPKGSGGSII